MQVFVAGASGAVGRPLIARLIRQGHIVTGMTSSGAGVQLLEKLGASAVQVDAFDRDAVALTLRRLKPEVVIDELTSLPKDPAELPAASPADRKLRIEGGGNLYRAAQACGVRRYVQQGSGFFLKAGAGLAHESEPLATDASPGIAAFAQMYSEIEARVLSSQKMEGTVLRYGFFYGPGTWYNPDGGRAAEVRSQKLPIVGHGQAIWSFVHIEDAAIATVASLTAGPGVYNVVDDDPSPVVQWLPAFARWVDAPPPPRITEDEARAVAGEDSVYYGTKLRGASNTKAREHLGFRPRGLQWLQH